MTAKEDHILTEVIGVRFKNKGKIYFFDPCGNQVEHGQHVIVETAKGLEYAECVSRNYSVQDEAVRAPLRPVVRVATPEDDRRAEENRRLEQRALKVCNEKIAAHGLEMKIIDVEYNFEGNKILFFFTAEGRVDFRELVKDLASVFKTRIELRQIGVRDEARMLGGIGICGKPFCCAQFLDDFQPVSIKMAKTQGISMNPAKISGACGRLMCCLKYEQDAYEELVKNVPKVDSFVETPLGKGMVLDVNILKGTVRVKLEDQTEVVIRTFNADEVEVLGGKGKRAEYLAARARGEIEAPKPIARLRRGAPAPAKPEPVVYEAAPTLILDTVDEAASGGEAKPQQKSSRSRNRRRSQAKREPQQEARPAEAKQPEEGAKKSGNHRRRHRRGGKKPGGQEKPAE